MSSWLAVEITEIEVRDTNQPPSGMCWKENPSTIILTIVINLQQCTDISSQLGITTVIGAGPTDLKLVL